MSMLNVRRKGQGKEGHKKPVLFPKIVFLYDENLHGPGKPLEDVFEAGVRCSAKTMYPDWLSLTGEGLRGEHVQEVRQDHFPHGLPRLPVSLVRERGHASGGREGRAGVRGPLQHRRGIPAPAHDPGEGETGEPGFL